MFRANYNYISLIRKYFVYNLKSVRDKLRKIWSIGILITFHRNIITNIGCLCLYASFFSYRLILVTKMTYSSNKLFICMTGNKCASTHSYFSGKKSHSHISDVTKWMECYYHIVIFIHSILYVQRIKWFKINHFQLIPTVMILQCKICWKLSQDVIHFPRKQIDIVIEVRVCQILLCYS
jgi:hypothetical protein